MAVGGEAIEHRSLGIEALLAVEPEDRTALPSLEAFELHALHAQPATHRCPHPDRPQSIAHHGCHVHPLGIPRVIPGFAQDSRGPPQ